MNNPLKVISSIKLSGKCGIQFVHSRLLPRSNRSINVYLINLIFSEVKLPAKRIFARLLISSSLSFNLMRNISRGNEVSRKRKKKKKRFHSTFLVYFWHVEPTFLETSLYRTGTRSVHAQHTRCTEFENLYRFPKRVFASSTKVKYSQLVNVSHSRVISIFS